MTYEGVNVSTSKLCKQIHCGVRVSSFLAQSNEPLYSSRSSIKTYKHDWIDVIVTR